jgi:hypothetical protein
MKLVSLFVLVIYVSTFPVFAQTKPASNPSPPQVVQNDAVANTQPPPPTTDTKARRLSMLTDSELFLSIEVLVFGALVVFLEFFLLRKAAVTPEEALRVYAVTLIIVGTLFAITAGFSSQDVAPAMGLFGTIAGYLLGKKTSTDERKERAGENR